MEKTRTGNGRGMLYWSGYPENDMENRNGINQRCTDAISRTSPQFGYSHRAVRGTGDLIDL